MSNKEEQSEAYIKPTILDRNKKYLKEDNWELGLEYTDFTGYEVQCAFEAGWDAATKELSYDVCEFIKNNLTKYYKHGMFHTGLLIEDLKETIEKNNDKRRESKRI